MLSHEQGASHSLWVFFDDFPMFSPVELCESADESASELLDILGWLHAKTGLRESLLKLLFNVLGCKAKGT